MVIDPEVEKFDALGQQWWNRQGPMRVLHHINPARMAFIEQSLPLKGKRVLDMGCGGGLLAESLAERGAEVTAVDASSSAIAVAKAHAERRGLALEFIHGSVSVVEGRQFDAIVCMEMLEHVEQPSEFVHQFSQLLVQGGQLFLSTIHRQWRAYLATIIAAEYLLNLLPRQTHDYAKFIRPSELAAMLRANDFGGLTTAGLSYNPLTKRASLTKDVSVNYLMRAVLV